MKVLMWLATPGQINNAGLLFVFAFAYALGAKFGWLGFTVIIASAILVRWSFGRVGLNQWPEPYGIHYKRWLSLPPGHGDYYAWLAAQKRNQEPWRTWAERERR